MKLWDLLSNNYHFDIQPFCEIAEKIRKLGYVNIWEWKGGRKYSPNKQLRSKVFVTHEVDYFELKIQMLRKSSDVLFETVIRPKEVPDELIIHNLLGELIWTSDSAIEIVSRLKLKLPQEKPIRASYVQPENS
jgi:hypothetical protein